MNKQAKSVVRACRRIVKQVRKDNYFSATIRANFTIELDKFDSKKGYYLIIVRDRRVGRTVGDYYLSNRYRLRVDWLNVRTPFFESDLWKMVNDVLTDMIEYEAKEARAAAQKKVATR